jgi:hypothetical protein
MRTSTVLIIVGALALIAGITAVGFGVPVQEFSFGNTLIMAGATVATGGLIVIALGAVTSQLQRLNDALAQPAMAAHVHEPFQPMTAAAEPHPFEPRGPSTPPEFPMPAESSPMLRNPEETVQVEEEVSLSPQVPATEPEQVQEEPRELPAWMRPRPEPSEDKPQRSSIFDSMWPPEKQMFGHGDTEEKTEPVAREQPEVAEEPEAAPAVAEDVAAEPAPPAEKPRAIAILKSGVVDGMSYTLYVDGSIEAELPQGTLRFASIHELRAHLEQNG